MRTKLIIRDGHATLEGDNTTFECVSGSLEIVAEDGRTLFDLRLIGNSLEISGGVFCKHGGKLLQDRFVIQPVAANCVNLVRTEAQEKR